MAINKDKKSIYERAVGKVSNLATKVDHNPTKDEIYTSGIAHTRWATHGGVTEENCHPHYSQSARFYIVHNGIIENYSELKKHLQAKGYIFYSQTDTEVVSNLIQDNFDGNLKTTLEKVIAMMIGAYALAVIDTENPNELIGMKLGSPLIV
jgi:glucosamine--fructose-6-phosphate aminotransferase (isomerizing)